MLPSCLFDLAHLQHVDGINLFDLVSIARPPTRFFAHLPAFTPCLFGPCSPFSHLQHIDGINLFGLISIDASFSSDALTMPPCLPACFHFCLY
jgi:hypothetical protein